MRSRCGPGASVETPRLRSRPAESFWDQRLGFLIRAEPPTRSGAWSAASRRFAGSRAHDAHRSQMGPALCASTASRARSAPASTPGCYRPAASTRSRSALPAWGCWPQAPVAWPALARSGGCQREPREAVRIRRRTSFQALGVSLNFPCRLDTDGSIRLAVGAWCACYLIPEHWEHLRTSNPVESVFATVRHRTVRVKGALSHTTARLMVFKLVMAASKSWRRLKSENQLPLVIQGVMFTDGVAVTRCQHETPPDRPRHPNSTIALPQDQRA